MKTAVEKFFAEDVNRLTTQLAEIEDRIEPLEWPENIQILRDLEAALGQGLEACRRLDARIREDKELLEHCQQRFREETAPWCDQSWIIHRARSKPRGFPGDYQMLSAIYDGIPIARGIGGYLDRLCLKMTLGRAVDARMKNTRRFLQEELATREGDVTILNVASGPCREYRQGLPADGLGTIRVKCVDSDEGALKYVSRHVAKSTSRNLIFDCFHHNVLRMRSANAVIEKFGRNDIIYSVGLADYLPDKMLIPILRAWRESLHPDGVLFVAFKDALRYDKVEYQWLMDWHFLQRRESDCLRLLEEAGFDMNRITASRDETGVILQYLYRPQHARTLRLDRPAQPLVHHAASTAKLAE
jgi:extracellular factor (EF) 3-hydroxypalmitic acid methyl ester biosynthesis protein